MHKRYTAISMGESHPFFRSIIGWIIFLWLCLGCLRELQWDPSDRWTTCHSQRSSRRLYLFSYGMAPYIQKAICNLHWYSWHGLAQFWVMIKWVPIKKVMGSALLPCLRHAMKITVQMRGPCSEPSWSGHPPKQSDEPLSGPGLACRFCVAQCKFTAVKVARVVAHGGCGLQRLRPRSDCASVFAHSLR